MRWWMRLVCSADSSMASSKQRVAFSWSTLPAVVAGFLLQHAAQGWCPPLPLMRRMGVRTRDEINQERYALKALRGDFDEVAMDFDPNTRLGAVLVAVNE